MFSVRKKQVSGRFDLKKKLRNIRILVLKSDFSETVDGRYDSKSSFPAVYSP